MHIKLLGDLPVGSGTLDEARLAARYLSKYVGKDVDDERRLAGLHRYEVAQGFQPERIACYGGSAEDVIEQRLRLHGIGAGAGLALGRVRRGGVGRPPAGRSGLTDDLQGPRARVGRAYLRWTKASR